MLSSDELIKAKQAQQEKEKEEENLRKQEGQKARALWSAKVNAVLQILKQYPTLAKNVGKKTESEPCFSGYTGLFNKKAAFTNKNVWYIGNSCGDFRINPKCDCKKKKEYETKLMLRPGEYVSDADYNANCYIDETGQCWLKIYVWLYGKNGTRCHHVLYPINIEDMVDALLNNCIRHGNWQYFATGDRAYLDKSDFSTPEVQLIDEYFRLNLLS